MKRARDAYPDKYAQAVARKRARRASAPSVQAVVRSELRKAVDWKYADASGSGGVSYAGTMVGLYSNLTRGDLGINNFLGNTVIPQGIRVKYSWTTDQSSSNVRVILFQWFDAATPVATGILQTVSAAQSCLSPLLVTNLDYIKVLHDKTFAIAPTASDAGTVYGAGTVFQDVYIPGKKLRPTRFNSTTNAVQDGNIYMLLVTDDQVLSYPACTYHTRVTFNDK